MFPGCLQDFSRMFSGCSDGSCGPGGIWWSFQMKVWTLMIQRNSMIPNYSMIPAIRWSIGSMDFDNPKVYGDSSITDGLVSIPYKSKNCFQHCHFLPYSHDQSHTTWKMFSAWSSSLACFAPIPKKRNRWEILNFYSLLCSRLILYNANAFLLVNWRYISLNLLRTYLKLRTWF